MSISVFLASGSMTFGADSRHSAALKRYSSDLLIALERCAAFFSPLLRTSGRFVPRGHGTAVEITGSPLRLPRLNVSSADAHSGDGFFRLVGAHPGAAVAASRSRRNRDRPSRVADDDGCGFRR